MASKGNELTTSRAQEAEESGGQEESHDTSQDPRYPELNDMTETLDSSSSVQNQGSDNVDFDTVRLEELVAAKKTTHGERHAETLKALLKLEHAYRFEGQFDKAEQILQGVVEIQRQDLGETHRDTLTSMTRIAEVKCALGSDAESESMQIDVMEKRKAVLGEYDLDTINSMEQLAIWYQNRGEYFQDKPDLTKSIHFWKSVVAANKVALGNDNDETIRAMDGVEEVQAILNGLNAGK